MSGTSMSCPAVAGAGALLAVLDPREEDQTGEEYAREIRNRLLSCVSENDALSDLCASGGYVDLNLLSRSEPAISDALCDVEKETITLMGSELKGCRLSFRRLLQNDAYEVVLPSGGMTVEYSDDGKTITIRNAKNLFGTCTEQNIC